MTIIEYYQIALNSVQKEIVEKVIEEAEKSKVTRNALESLRSFYCESLIKFWGETMSEYDRLSLGFSPNWETIDIDWGSSLDGITFGKKTWKHRFLDWSGLGDWMINIMFGLNIPRSSTKEQKDLAAKAIMVAAILSGIVEVNQ